MIIRVVRYSLIAGVLALAGCTDAAGEPSTLPDLTAPPSGTPTPTAPRTAEPPVEPDNAHEYSAEGVEAFTLYAIEVINYAYQTNDVTYLERIMTPDCQFCENAIYRLTTISNAGGRVEGGKLIGIVTDGDLRRKLSPEMFAKRAREIMTASPKTIAPDAPIADAIAIMNEKRITLLFAVEDGRPVGVVHMHDLLAAWVR